MRLLLGMMLLAAPAAQAQQPTVIFDQAHGQWFMIEHRGPLELSGLANAFRDAGLLVRASTLPLSDAVLAQATGLIISGAFQPLTEPETAAVLRFVARGGRVAIMLHIAQPLAPLMARLGLFHSNGVVREAEGLLDTLAINFTVSRLEKHPLTEGVKSPALYGAWALNAEAPPARIIGRTSPGAWVDLNRSGRFDSGDAKQSLGVMAVSGIGQGEVAVFGDDAMFQNQFLVGQNLVLARNLARWLSRAGTRSQASD